MLQYKKEGVFIFQFQMVYIDPVYFLKKPDNYER